MTDTLSRLEVLIPQSSGKAAVSRLIRTHVNLIFCGILAAVFSLFAFASRTPLFDLARIGVIIAIVALGVSDWRDKGHGWLPALSWAIPFGFLLSIPWLLARPGPLHVVGFWLMFAFGMSMLMSDSAAKWWYKAVLRRPYKT